MSNRDEAERLRAEGCRLTQLGIGAGPFMRGVYTFRANRLYEQADRIETDAIAKRYVGDQ